MWTQLFISVVRASLPIEIYTIIETNTPYITILICTETIEENWELRLDCRATTPIH